MSFFTACRRIEVFARKPKPKKIPDIAAKTEKKNEKRPNLRAVSIVKSVIIPSTKQITFPTIIVILSIFSSCLISGLAKSFSGLVSFFFLEMNVTISNIG
ncbi:hypothetical protein ES705_12541 [subsurface metagenome]